MVKEADMTSFSPKTCVTCFRKVNRPSAVLEDPRTTIHQFESVVGYMISAKSPHHWPFQTYFSFVTTGFGISLILCDKT